MHKGVPMSRTSTGSVLPGYKRGVAFDTFEAADDLRTGGGTGVDYSFTLKVRSDGYKRTRVSREYLAATDVRCRSPFPVTMLIFSSLAQRIFSSCSELGIE